MLCREELEQLAGFGAVEAVVEGGQGAEETDRAIAVFAVADKLGDAVLFRAAGLEEVV